MRGIGNRDGLCAELVGVDCIDDGLYNGSGGAGWKPCHEEKDMGWEAHATKAKNTGGTPMPGPEVSCVR